jgi:YVTN family beta-propeller protein
MKQLKNNYLFIILAFCSVLASCSKDTPATGSAVITNGLYILNQGSFNGNNSTLSFYDYNTKTVTADKFAASNGRGLGDTGNDIEIYGSKTYVVVNVSSTLEIINTKTAKSIKQIALTNNGTPRQPRDIVFYKGNAFISSFDGYVAVLDTVTLSVSKYIKVGDNPEQMAITNGKLYVANSGGLNYPIYSNTVSVIDLTTQTVTKTLTVGTNPIGVVADAYGFVYVQAAGNYGAIGSSLTIIDAGTDVVKSTANFDGGNMTIQGDNIFFTTSDKKIKVYNAKSQSVTAANFITDGTAITTPYSIAVDSYTGEVFVGDAKNYASNGSVFAFDRNGVREYTITVGISPGKIAIVR